MFSQVLSMFLFSVLDQKDSYNEESAEFSLLINDPLKTTACARCIVETSYGVLMQVDQDETNEHNINQIEHLLLKIEN